MLIDWYIVNMIAEELAASSFVAHVVQGECFWTPWTVMIEELGFSETSVTVYNSIWHNIPEDLNLSWNLKAHSSNV
jgi:hypothetical protein